MSKERFKFIKGGAIDTVNDKEYVEEEVVDLLNELYEDFNCLAKFIGEFKVEKFKLKLRNLRLLEDKIEEQQANIKDLNFVINFQEKEIGSLKALLKEKEALTEENEQLKQQLDKIPPRIKEVWLQ